MGLLHDEFFMKRIGGLKQQLGAGVTALTVDGRSPEQQIDACTEVIRAQEEAQRTVFRRLVEELHKHGITVTTYDALESDAQKALRDYYYDNVFPLVTPQTSDPAHPFPFVSNLFMLRQPPRPYSSLDRAAVSRSAGRGVGARPLGSPKRLHSRKRDSQARQRQVTARRRGARRAASERLF